jgi:hypothetical protein
VPGLGAVTSVLKETISWVFSVIKKPSKFIVPVPHMKSNGTLILKISTQNPGFRLQCNRSVVLAARFALVTGLWLQASGSDVLSDEIFLRIQQFK